MVPLRPQPYHRVRPLRRVLHIRSSLLSFALVWMALGKCDYGGVVWGVGGCDEGGD